MRTTTKIRAASVVMALFLVSVLGTISEAHDPIGGTGGTMQRTEVSGTMDREGYPKTPLDKENAGGGCIVDVTQEHSVSGSMSGTLEIDYRLLIAGSCESQAEMDDQEWIAHGVFEGMVDDSSRAASFSYVGEVKDGGNLEGTIVFSGGLVVELRIMGSFCDAPLCYRRCSAQGADDAGY